MKKAEIINWLRDEFRPLTLATPDSTLEQLVENAVRYFNTHSAYKWIEMLSPVQTPMHVLSPNFKNVFNVYPATESVWIWKDHPLWTLLGITLLDNVTADLIHMATTFQNYRTYVGTDFRWHFVQSQDPAIGGQLYVVNLPHEVTEVCVVGSRRIHDSDDITMEHILEWILQYTKALLKQTEGNLLRKSDVIGVKNDGQVLYQEGDKEKEALEARLAIEGRWAALSRRF